MGAKRTCSIKGCGRKHHGRGLCRLHYMRLWRKANPEKVKLNRERWRKANPEKWAENKRRGSQKWRQANLEKARAATRKSMLKWRRTNPKYCKRWRDTNREKVRGYNRRRRAYEAATVYILSSEEEINILAQGCFFAHLGDCAGLLSLAHNIAVSKGGNTTRANIFCLCRRHNAMMSTKSLNEMMTQLELKLYKE